LRRKAQRYERLLQTITDYIYMVEVQNGQAVGTFHGPGCAAVTGYESEEYAADPLLWQRMVHPDDREFVVEQSNRVLHGEDVASFEHRIIHKDGSIRWVSNTPVSHYDSSGLLVSYDGVIKDITAVRVTTESLRRSTADLQAIIERNADAIVVASDGITCFANPAAAELFGYARDELLGVELGLPIVVGERTVVDIVQHGNHRIAEMQAVEIEWGGFSAVLASFHDITLRKQFEDELERRIDERTNMLQCATVRLLEELTRRECAEQALRESEARFRGIVENSTDGIGMTDEEGHIIVWNRGIETISGLSYSEVCGRPFWDVLFQLFPEETRSPEILADYVARFKAFLKTGYTRWDNQLYEHSYQRADGKQIYVQHLVFSIKTDRGFQLAFVARDITQQKQAELERRRALEVAESATRTRANFLAKMSHEIRTPLNAVCGMTSLLLDTTLNPEQHDFVHTIRTSSDALLAVINDFLDFSKLEASRVELEHQPFLLHNCIEDALDLLAPKAAEKNLDLTYLVSDDVPAVVVGDDVRLRQILVNLLSNAVKFTDQGEVVVEVTGNGAQGTGYEHRHDDQQNTYHQSPITCHLAVRDTGIGIPADQVECLFQPFTQAETSTTRRYGGTGLGLTISKHLAELMGGTIWIESTEGEGSTFHLTIQVEQAAPDITPETLMPATRANHSFSTNEKGAVLRDKRVLLVDDNATNRFVLERQTRSWGMHPLVAASGAEALELLNQEHPVDLVVLDMHMPHMDGLQLAGAIRQWEQTRASNQGDTHASPNNPVPIVLYTSITYKHEAMRRASAFITTFLTKPIKPAILRATLIHICCGEPLQHGTEPVSRQTHTFPLSSSARPRIPLRILLAEDNTINQKVALAMLHRLGYQADVAMNGMDVLEAVARQPYDVILMDVEMPGMDGIETTRHLREVVAAAQIPHIIAMTAHALQGDRQWLLDSGMDEYISKPVCVEELAARLHRLNHRADTHLDSTQEVAESSGEAFSPPQPHASDLPLLDHTVLARFATLVGTTGDDLVEELIRIYLADTPRLLKEIHQAVERGSIEEYTRALHTLKSSSAQLGAARLAELCKVAERQGQSEDEHEKTRHIEQIEAEYARVQAVLKNKEERNKQ
jgi:PAS domain S-box-containing protein